MQSPAPSSSSLPRATARAPHADDWHPNPGPQTRFLGLTCFEALYGGSAGGGKSISLLVDAIRYVGRGYGPAYHALLLRRTFPELEASLIKESWTLYPRLGAKYNEQKKRWRFPGGEIVEFGHAQHEKDVHAYQGAELQFVGFDELTSFTQYQYLYLFSRARSSRGIPCRVRGATNPGGEGHAWVFTRFGAWLDPKYVGWRAGPGEIRYFLRRNGDDAGEDMVSKGTPKARSRTFVPARLEDNPHLFDDGEYEANLATLDPVTRARLRDGNWLIQPGRGMYFRRDWFEFVDEAPVQASRARYWDRAATEPKPGKDPDWTVGLKLARTAEGIYYVEDVARMRGNPGEVERFVKATAELDGKALQIALEQEPGASGKSEVASYLRLLQGWNVRAYPKRIDKVVAAGPASAQCNARNMRIVRAPWNDEFIRELEQFPEGAHDDQVDGLSGAFTVLTTGIPASLDDFRSFRERAPRTRF